MKIVLKNNNSKAPVRARVWVSEWAVGLEIVKYQKYGEQLEIK